MAIITPSQEQEGCNLGAAVQPLCCKLSHPIPLILSLLLHHPPSSSSSLCTVGSDMMVTYGRGLLCYYAGFFNSLLGWPRHTCIYLTKELIHLHRYNSSWRPSGWPHASGLRWRQITMKTQQLYLRMVCIQKIVDEKSYCRYVSHIGAFPKSSNAIFI